MKKQWHSLRVHLVLLVALAPVACEDKKDDVPEHVAQRRMMEEKIRQAQEEMKAEAEGGGEAEGEPEGGSTSGAAPEAEATDIRFWPPAVKRGYYVLFRARGMSVPPAAQALAKFGASATPAFERIAKNKNQPHRKRMLASFMLADINMFRPVDLAELARSFDLPFAQRAAIEALVRIGGPESRELVRGLKEELAKDVEASPSGAEVHPLVEFIEKTSDEADPWGYGQAQLMLLDQIMQADTPEKLKAAMAALGDGDLKQGLVAIIRTPASAPEVKSAVAHRLVVEAQPDLKVLRDYVKADQPAALRLAAAEQLLKRDGRRARSLIKKLARRPGDPTASALRRLLDRTAKD